MTVFYPPYFGSFGDAYNYHNGDGTPRWDVSHYEDRNIGLISTHNRNHLVYPGEAGQHVTYAYSGMQFNIQMESSGRLKVVSTLVASGDGLWHKGGLFDASGVSSAHVTQGANYHMWISDPENEFIKNLLLYDRGDDAGYWEYTVVVEGELRQYTFVSQARFNAGDWVLLNAHIDNFQDAWMNDMQFIGQVRNHWIISQIDVTSV